MKNINLLLIFFLVFAISCRKNIDDSMIVDPPPPPVENNYTPIEIPIISSVRGIILDENGLPVEGAIVSLNTQSQTSNPFGGFQFSNASMNENGTFLQVEKSGYFKTGRRFFPKSDAVHNVRIQLIEKNFNQSFQADGGGTVSFDNGGEIIFSENSIKTENGDAYSGEVKVALKWLDPTADVTLEQMPGALQGVTTLGDEVVLETYGMIAVELESPIGEPLNIADNQTAEIKMPVPASLLSNAPTEIPLWSFNYQYGVWAEDGKAVLENGFYVGVVEHFSFWNCDFPIPLVNLDLTLLDEETQEPLFATEVKLVVQNSGITASAFTNDEGKISGKIPQNEVLELQVLNTCDEVIHRQIIGPFPDAASLTIEVKRQDNIVISGNLLDCSGGSVTTGVLMVEIDGNHLNYPITGSPFEVTVPTCINTTEVSISGANLEDFERSDYFTFPVTDSIDMGDLATCGDNLIGFAVVTRDSLFTEIVGDLEIDFEGNDSLFIIGGIPTPIGQTLAFGFEDFDGIGDYSSRHIFMNCLLPDLQLLVVRNFPTAEITDYGTNPGDLIAGSFSGIVANQYNGVVQHNHVSIEFAFYRD